MSIIYHIINARRRLFLCNIAYRALKKIERDYIAGVGKMVAGGAY